VSSQASLLSDGQAAPPVGVEPGGAPARASTAAIVALGLGHGTADFYPGFLASVLPYLMLKLGFSLTVAGSLTSFSDVITSLLQPIMGYVADARHPRPWGAWGLVMAAVFFCLLGFAPNVPILAVLILAGGFGVALYHPQGAAMATRISRGKAGLAMSLFATGGSVGYALGPLLAVLIVERWGLRELIVLAPPGILAGLLIQRVMQKPLAEQARRHQPLSLGLAFKGAGSSLAWLLAIMTLRSAVTAGIASMLPFYFEAKGMSLAMGATAIFIFRLAGGLGVFFGGPVSDRFGRKPVLAASFVLTLPFLLLFFHSAGLLALLWLGLGSAVLTSSTPVNTVMAQEATPKAAAIASGLMMGVGWALGSLSVALIGYLADRHGILVVLPPVSLLIVAAGAALSALLPQAQRAAA
jgi:FSR family fosmidomycin resistance protein-like MFS transporter